MNRYKYFYLTIGIILIDQAIKLLVNEHMVMGSGGEIAVFGDWFKLHYILNEGMAFGMSFDSEFGKLFLSLFRLMTTLGIGYLLLRLSKTRNAEVLLWSIAAILGGAIGNLIDSIFYGVWLDNAPYDAATPWFHGQVVDMFYFDLWEGYVAEWVPLWGGKNIALLPIFNFADVAIFVGVVLILIFQKRIFSPRKGEITL